MFYVVPKGRSLLKSKFKTDALLVAKMKAIELQEKHNQDFEVVEFGVVWTTQTLHEALLEATDVPYMARPGDYASQFAEEAGISYESALSQLNMD